MSNCISCLEDTKNYTEFACNKIGCTNVISLCESCYLLWPFKVIHKQFGRTSTCRIRCIINENTYISDQYVLPNVLKENQEEILHESRKNSVKLLIKELNYFINDILNEIIEY